MFQSGDKMNKVGMAISRLRRASKDTNASEKSVNFFEKIFHRTLKQFASVDLTSGEYQDLIQTLFMMKYGSGVFNPIVCKGPKCPFAKICPLEKVEKSPLEAQCPIELATIVNRASYWSGVFSENGYDIESNSLYEHYINKLVYIDILLQRCSWSEACGYSDIVLESIAKVSRTGETFKEIVENPIIGVSEKLIKLQTQMLNELVLTPREIYKKKAVLKVRDEQSDFAVQQMKKRQIAQKALESKEIYEEIPEHFDVEELK